MFPEKEDTFKTIFPLYPIPLQRLEKPFKQGGFNSKSDNFGEPKEESRAHRANEGRVSGLE